MAIVSPLRERGIDPVPLLLAHMACADRQLHVQETRLIEAALLYHAGGPTRAAVEAILSQQDDSPSVSDVLNAITVEQHSAVLEQVLALACADGVKAPEELGLLYVIAEHWGVSAGEIQSMWEAAKAASLGIENESAHLEVDNLLVLALDATVGKTLLDDVAVRGLPKWTARLARHRQGNLLAGPEYACAVERCAWVAAADFAFVEPVLSDCVHTLKALLENLHSASPLYGGQGGRCEAGRIAEEAVTEIREQVAADLHPKLLGVRQALFAKHRALNRLTIAFMGKTKAGKSTLHSVVTGCGWDGIGVGAQRTTRYNRVYEWRNLRIIDTPGIGAPEAGGRTDEEIAESIVDEADIVCFVVTNDSQQLSEFAFLERLRAKAKPLLILLNVKKNIDPEKPRSVERFLRDQDRLFQRKGNNDLLGHENRIREYAKSAYGHDFFDIVPVHLHAARLARTGVTGASRELWEASRAGSFLNTLQSAVFREGPIRRSQTLIGSTSCDVARAASVLESIVGKCDTMQRQLKQKGSAALSDIDQASDDAKRSLSSGIKQVFNAVLAEVPRFVEEHWKDSSKELRQAWGGVLGRFQFEDRLRRAVEAANSEFQRKVQESLEEIGRELQILGERHCADATLSGVEDTFSYRSLFAIGGSLVNVAGVTLTIMVGPIGLVFVGLGVVISLLSSCFKSKAEKRRNASRKIGEELRGHLTDKQGELIDEQLRHMSEQVATVRAEVGGYFDGLVDGVSGIRDLCAAAELQLSRSRDQLDRAFASRVLGWLSGDELSDGVRILAVEREAGRRLLIRTVGRFSHDQDPEYICRVLQEELVLEP